MKKYILIIIATVLVIVMGVLISLEKTRSIDMEGLTFEQLCNNNGDQWMVMEPWRDGKKISDQQCEGCMIGSNHFCAPEAYVDYVRSLSGEKVNMEINDSSKMHDMTHEAMTAHGGNTSSVDIHLYKVEFLRNKHGLAFRITEDGSPVSQLDAVHDKIMHLVLVRNDLRYFDHIHPVQIEPGIFSGSYNFSAPGDYRIWIDFTKEGMQHIVDFDTTITVSEKSETNRIGNLTVTMRMPEKIRVNQPVAFAFDVTENDEPIHITERFLAASGHMIVIDKNLDEFGHMHDEIFDRDNTLSFEYEFTKTGLYKIWVQFSHNGDKTAEFQVNINE